MFVLLIAILHEVLWPNSDDHTTIILGWGLNHCYSCYSFLLLDLDFLFCLFETVNVSLEVLMIITLSRGEVIMHKRTWWYSVYK